MKEEKRIVDFGNLTENATHKTLPYANFIKNLKNNYFVNSFIKIMLFQNHPNISSFFIIVKRIYITFFFIPIMHPTIFFNE